MRLTDFLDKDDKSKDFDLDMIAKNVSQDLKLVNGKIVSKNKTGFGTKIWKDSDKLNISFTDLEGNNQFQSYDLDDMSMDELLDLIKDSFQESDYSR